MLRAISSAFSLLPRNLIKSAINNVPKTLPSLLHSNQFGTFNVKTVVSLGQPSLACNTNKIIGSPLLFQNTLLPTTLIQQRPRTKFSLKSGKSKTVKAVVKRFYRLHWGGWIRTKAGRHRHMWRKTAACKRRLRQHVFCTASQSWMLDKMVTKFWKKPKYYVDDPYEQYHTREEFYHTRRKPLMPPDY